MAQSSSTPSQLALHMGRIVREARTRSELTQADVAERIGLVTEVYGRLERGNMLPSVRTLRKLCRALGLDANALLGLATRESPVALEDSGPPPPKDPPALRRMVRMLRAMDSAQLVALQHVSRALLQMSSKRRGSRRAAPGRAAARMQTTPGS